MYSLISSENIKSAFENRVKSSERIDLAVAWATDSDALKIITTHMKKRKAVRAVVGISRNFTKPKALYDLYKVGQLQIADSPTAGIFHKKIYIFYEKNRVVAWIGSANLTNGGFGKNGEAVLEIIDGSKEIQKFFSKIWKRKEPAEESDIDSYAKRWRPPVYVPDEGRGQNEEAINIRINPLLKALAQGNWRWFDYESALQTLDSYWQQNHRLSIEDGTRSWIHTIETGNEIIRRRLGSWDKLSQFDKKFLLGKSAGDEYASGCLGYMSARLASRMIYSDEAKHRRTKREIHALLKDLQAYRGNHFPEKASDLLAELCLSYVGIGPAVASRLITLARPDRAVSINKASQACLAYLTGLSPTTLGRINEKTRTADNYRTLLEWVESQEWHRAPSGRRQKLIWARAALLDAFVYIPQ